MLDMTSGTTSRGELIPIGEFAEPSFVRLPEPVLLFRKRAERMRALAAGHTLAPYLTFLAELTAIQERLATDLSLPRWLPTEQLAGATGTTEPPVARGRFPVDESVVAVADALLAALADVAIPQATRETVERLKAADATMRQAALQRALAEPAPADALAEHALLSAALQVTFSGIAATLRPERLLPLADGGCPVCGSPPLASLVVGWPGARGTRYCACGLCGSLWNYVRIKCTLCSSTQGIAYLGVEGDPGTVKAETCDSCGSYVKILHQHTDPALDPVADDVATLGLDLLVRKAGFRRGAFNPFLVGY
jgi:FdhE protein